VRSKFLLALNSKPWFPVELNTEIIQPGFPFRYALAAPCNVFMCSSRDRLCSPHWLRFGFDAGINGDPNVNIMLKDLLAFRSNQPTPLQCVELFVWMCKQPHVTANATLMANTYETLFSFVRQFPMHPHSQFVMRRIASDDPFLWFPTDVNPSKSVSRRGQLYPLSHVVMDDLSKYFSEFPLLSPVRVLRDHYQDEDCKIDEFCTLFSRRNPNPNGNGQRLGTCRVCKCLEGRFGSRGLPLRSEAGSAPKQAQQPCSCVDAGFGSLVPHLPGLIAESPTLHHMLMGLRELKRGILGSLSTGPDKLMECKLMYNNILLSLSRNIWNTFNIAKSWHPYASPTLRALNDAFQQESLLPIKSADGEDWEFVTASRNCLAIDDDSMFSSKMLSAALKSYHCVSAHSEVVSSDLQSEESDYSLERLEADEQALVRATADEFYRAVTELQPKVCIDFHNSLISCWLLSRRMLFV
jgi:hypothetical protein